MQRKWTCEYPEFQGKEYMFSNENALEPLTNLKKTIKALIILNMED